MPRSILLVLAALLLAMGCVAAHHAPIADNDSDQLSGKTLQRSVYQKPSFSAMTAGKAMFGLLGAAAMISAGNTIIQENAVEDPALGIGQDLAKSLARKYDIRALASEPGRRVGRD